MENSRQAFGKELAEFCKLHADRFNLCDAFIVPLQCSIPPKGALDRDGSPSQPKFSFQVLVSYFDADGDGNNYHANDMITNFCEAHSDEQAHFESMGILVEPEMINSLMDRFSFITPQISFDHLIWKNDKRIDEATSLAAATLPKA